LAKTWHIITGEYPPQPGGISDHSALLAAGLAAHGAEVQVWSPDAHGAISAVIGVTVHRVAGRWSPDDLARLGDELDKFVAPRRLFVQHTPNTWGYRGLNLHFCKWLLKRKNLGDDIWLMVHEPFYPWLLRDKPARWLLAAGQRWMMRTLLAASSRVYVSIPGWEKYLRAYERGTCRAITWLPIFSTIPVVSDERKVAELRQTLKPDGQTVIGSFSTFGGAIGEMLFELLPPLLLKHPERVGLLLGRGGEHFAERLRASHPSLSARLHAPGELPPGQVSLNLQACDLLVQPYPDGVSSRRTSVMAGLAHGIPIVTTEGFLSEPVWAETNCVALSIANDSKNFVRVTEDLLADPDARAGLAERAETAYVQNFALARTLKELCEE
jgi:glycosyltransferase involved in cell wall biosynthesis